MKFIKVFLLSLFLLNSIAIYTQINNSLVLNGCTDYLEIPDNDLLDYNQVISIECWIRPNCDDQNRVFISKEWCNGEYGYYLSVNNGRLFWSYSINGNCSSPNSFRTVNQLIPAGEFTHIAVVHNQESIKLFVNGTEVLSEQNNGVFGLIHESSEPLRIGA